MNFQLPSRLAKEAVKQANAELRAKHESGEFDDGDPNHPKYNSGINYTRCVGLAWADLFAKQVGRATQGKLPYQRGR